MPWKGKQICSWYGENCLEFYKFRVNLESIQQLRQRQFDQIIKYREVSEKVAPQKEKSIEIQTNIT